MDQSMTQRTSQPHLETTSPLDLAALGMQGGAASEPAAGRAVPMLVTVRGPNTGSRYLLTEDVTVVGRHPDSDILLDDVTVSRRHAEFQRTGGGFNVSDLGSLNGTYVNRERVESAALVDRDEIQIGKFRLVFHAAG
jgi:pSer/pThr/pTyr-binding forkhead associated (FHA) protein